MPTFVRDPMPVEVSELIERRRRLGQDLLDEVWDGVLHMNPAPRGGHGALEAQLVRLLGPLVDEAGLVLTGIFNLGASDQNYRVPDLGVHRDWSDRVWYSTAALVAEIVSPGDESFEKFGFYASRGVEEIVIVDPDERAVKWFRLAGEGYEAVEGSSVLEITAGELAGQIDWSR